MLCIPQTRDHWVSELEWKVYLPTIDTTDPPTLPSQESSQKKIIFDEPVLRHVTTGTKRRLAKIWKGDMVRAQGFGFVVRSLAYHTADPSLFVPCGLVGSNPRQTPRAPTMANDGITPVDCELVALPPRQTSLHPLGFYEPNITSPEQINTTAGAFTPPLPLPSLCRSTGFTDLPPRCRKSVLRWHSF